LISFIIFIPSPPPYQVFHFLIRKNVQTVTVYTGASDGVGETYFQPSSRVQALVSPTSLSGGTNVSSSSSEDSTKPKVCPPPALRRVVSTPRTSVFAPSLHQRLATLFGSKLSSNIQFFSTLLGCISISYPFVLIRVLPISSEFFPFCLSSASDR